MKLVEVTERKSVSRIGYRNLPVPTEFYAVGGEFGDHARLLFVEYVEEPENRW